MSLRVENCTACGKAYMLEQYSPAFAEGEPRGVIKCPYCGNEHPGDPDFVYLGHSLPGQGQH